MNDMEEMIVTQYQGSGDYGHLEDDLKEDYVVIQSEGTTQWQRWQDLLPQQKSEAMKQCMQEKGKLSFTEYARKEWYHDKYNLRPMSAGLNSQKSATRDEDGSEAARHKAGWRDEYGGELAQATMAMSLSVNDRANKKADVVQAIKKATKIMLDVADRLSKEPEEAVDPNAPVEVTRRDIL